ncbi:MAG: hypothetical protein XD81_0379 [Bacteroidetes bacterium 38_7]|nr:MAG: hypothetical protein XD81_0379 [Bacteroidetes bacterium 38_7]
MIEGAEWQQIFKCPLNMSIFSLSVVNMDLFVRFISAFEGSSLRKIAVI